MSWRRWGRCATTGAAFGPRLIEDAQRLVEQGWSVIRTGIGEEFASKWQFLPYVERGITNFARVDICNVGGFTEAMKVAGWCEAHYIDLMPTTHWGPSARRRRSTWARPCPTSRGWKSAPR